MCAQVLRASFRDPSGFLFTGDDGVLYRQVNKSYQDDFELLETSGLYAELTRKRLLIEHEFASAVEPVTSDSFCIIRPRRLPFVSYPYEWAFSALKDAALLTLDVQLRALNRGMQLKDASSFNIQFDGCRPVLIDTLSFERYKADVPWKAYGQFCRHFLAPLALMAKTHVDAGYMLRDFIDGVPLDVASRMLPPRTRWSLGLQVHLHWHAKMIAKHQATGQAGQPSQTLKKRGRVLRMPKKRLQAYLENLRSTIAGLKLSRGKTQWADYYEENSYSPETFNLKRELVTRYLEVVPGTTAWDLGANTGVFSQIACQLGRFTCAFDSDPMCIEHAYCEGRKTKEANFLPLRMDLTNPSPSLGWAGGERDSLAQRGPADVLLALALVHHLAISNNVPLPNVAQFFRQLGKWLIIEFVPKSDPQVQRLLENRDDIFTNYDQNRFESAFAEHFSIKDSAPIGAQGRVLYLMQTK